MLSGAANAAVNTLAQIPAEEPPESVSSRGDFLYRSICGGNKYRLSPEEDLHAGEHLRRIVFGIVFWLMVGFSLATAQACIPLGANFWADGKLWGDGKLGELSGRGNLAQSCLFMLNAALLGLTSMAFGVPGHSNDIVTRGTLFATVVVELACFYFALNHGAQEKTAPWFESAFAVLLFGTWTCCVLEPHWRQAHESETPREETRFQRLRSLLPASFPQPIEHTLNWTTVPYRANSCRSINIVQEIVLNPYIRNIPEPIGRAYAMAIRAQSFLPGAREYSNAKFHLRRRPLIQLLMVTIYKVGLANVYQVCVSFTTLFIGFTSKSNNPGIVLFSFVGFNLVFGLMQILFKLLGFAIDKGKVGSSSFYYMGELFLLLSYAIFYRNLFSLMESWLELVALSLVHCGYEWMKYVFRSTRTWYDFWNGRGNIGGDMTLEEWQSIVSLEYGLRLMTSLYSIISYVGILYLLRNLTYNNYFYRFAANKFTEEEFQLAITFSFLSGLIEIGNALAIQKFFFGRLKLDFTQGVVNLMADTRMRIYIVLSVWITCTNAMVAQLNIQL